MADEVYIVAGGPSLRDFDWRTLRGKQVIAINNAAFRLPFAQHVYFADRDWFKHWEYELALHLGHLHQGVSDEHEWVDRSWVRRWDFCSSFTDVPGRIVGGCSGVAALNLAAQLGYRKLHLLGYDFSTGNFHDENLHNNHQPGQWWRQYETVLPSLAAHGIEIKSGAPKRPEAPHPTMSPPRDT